MTDSSEPRPWWEEMSEESLRGWWQEPAAGTLRQGDLLLDVTAFRIADLEPPAGDNIDVIKIEGHLILLTPSCDLEQHRVENALLARVFEINTESLLTWKERERGEAPKDSELKRRVELLRQGLVPSRFLLPGSPPHIAMSFVELREQAFAPVNYLEVLAPRAHLRLKHPFREKFGVWVGSSFSQVGIAEKDGLPRLMGGGSKQTLAAVEAIREM